MLDKVNTDNPIFLMVDSSIVKANTSHRREGRHIDGYWIECDSNGRWDSKSKKLGFHGGRGGHRAYLNSDNPDWSNTTLKEPESIILASSYTSSRGYIGEWDGVIGDGGSCVDIDVSHMDEITLEKNNVYIGNVGFIHESLPVHQDVERTLIRLNVKDWEMC